MQQASPDTPDFERIKNQLQADNQRLDANYNLLLMWNKVWSFGNASNIHLMQHFQKKFDLTKQRLEGQVEGYRREIIRLQQSDGESDFATQTKQLQQKIADIRDELEERELEMSLHEVRIVFFENIQSADFVLAAFQNYILPLLHGLFGASIFVIRELLREVKNLTYNFDSEIRYKLRLTLGSLGGMVIGFFLKDDVSRGLASLWPMAIAFLVGYNMETLFAVMDKLFNNVTDSLSQNAPGSAPNK